MKGLVPGFASLLLAMAATAAQGQSSNVGQLEGCWQLDEVVTTKLNGETVRRKVDHLCRYWIGAEKISHACRDRLGLVRQTSENPYEMPGPDKLLFRGYRTPEDVGFEQQRLRRTATYSEVTTTEKVPNPEIRRDSFFTRVPSAVDRCLPQAERVAARDAWSIWQGPELAREFRRGLIELELAMRLKDRDVLRIPADALRPEDRARAAEEFRKILDRTSALGMVDWAKQEGSLENIWSGKGVCTEHRQTLFLAAPEVRQWAADTARETIALLRVASRITAAMSLSPEETKVLLQQQSPVSKEAGEDLKRGLISELLLLPRAAVVAIAERPELARVVDSATDFAALRDLGKRNAEFFEKNGLQYTDVLRCPGQLSASLPIPERPSLEQAERAWKEDLELLKARIAYASDLNATGICAGVAKTVDIASLRASNGDYRLMKTTAGVPLAADASELLDVSGAYARGCHVPQNMKQARRVLEVFAVATKDRGKLALSAWCRLAHWNRHGLGGPNDEQQVASWERRVKEEIVPQGCYPTPPVDPANPWKVL